MLDHLICSSVILRHHHLYSAGGAAPPDAPLLISVSLAPASADADVAAVERPWASISSPLIVVRRESEPALKNAGDANLPDAASVRESLSMDAAISAAIVGGTEATKVY